jgi:ABC-type methionine transport system ATPase subunit
VFENVALAVRIVGRFADAEVAPRVRQALEEVGLAGMEGAFPSELSAGEKQRAAIARAIVNRPAVVLADEPTGALEPQSAADILGLLRGIHEEGAAILLVTTREEVAAALPGRVLRLEDGNLVGGPAPQAAEASPASAPAEASAPGAPPNAEEASPSAAAMAIVGPERPPAAAAPPSESAPRAVTAPAPATR